MAQASESRSHFKTARGGSGTIDVQSHIELHDPDRKIPFAITNHFSTTRVLTGADFDIESLQRAPDGTLWFGDEFGPFLLHTDANGKVLEAPIPLPDFKNRGKEVRSPQTPFSEESTAIRIMNAVRSHAFANGGTRSPVFSPYHVQTKFDDAKLGIKSSPDEHYARGKNSPSDLKSAVSDVFDVRSIKSAGYEVVTWTVNDLARMNVLLKAGVTGIISDGVPIHSHDPYVRKELAVDLMRLQDPAGISLPAGTGDVGVGNPFSFPFVTIEDVVVIDRNTIGVLNDNNYPFSVGRHVGTKQPDDNEFILIDLAQPLWKGESRDDHEDSRRR